MFCGALETVIPVDDVSADVSSLTPCFSAAITIFPAVIGRASDTGHNPAKKVWHIRTLKTEHFRA
jgi:hypothetical protein